MADSMLSLKEITKVFNQGTQDEKRALDDFTLEVADGDFITIIGSNGAGKTTLLNVIAGTDQPDQGQVEVDGQDVTRWPDFQMARFISRVFQSPTMGTAGEMSIEENLCMAELRGKKRGLKWGVTKNRRTGYREVLKVLDLGLENRLKQSVSLLSGGQRRARPLGVPSQEVRERHFEVLTDRIERIALFHRVIRAFSQVTLIRLYRCFGLRAYTAQQTYKQYDKANSSI